MIGGRTKWVIQQTFSDNDNSKKKWDFLKEKHQCFMNTFMSFITNGHNIDRIDAHWSRESSQKNQTSILHSNRETHVYIFKQVCLL